MVTIGTIILLALSIFFYMASLPDVPEGETRDKADESNRRTRARINPCGG